MHDLIKRSDALQPIYEAIKTIPFMQETNSWLCATGMVKDIPGVVTGNKCVCGNTFILEDFKYCPYCGKELKW